MTGEWPKIGFSNCRIIGSSDHRILNRDPHHDDHDLDHVHVHVHDTYNLDHAFTFQSRLPFISIALTSGISSWSIK